MSTAEQEARALLQGAVVHEVEADILEIEDDLRLPEETPTVSAAVVNPLNTTDNRTRYVGYMPVKLGSSPDVFWALVDTGAQVSVLSAGLASYADLYSPDMSNVFPASFAVAGYNGSRSYMPVLQTSIRLGARGGEERYVEMHFCILDSN